jgi:hypothetical protein
MKQHRYNEVSLHANKPHAAVKQSKKIIKKNIFENLVKCVRKNTCAVRIRDGIGTVWIVIQGSEQYA